MKRLPSGGVFECEIVDCWDGMSVLKISGDDADVLFANESGGHRWQMVPPGNKSGKVHSLTITVAVLPVVSKDKFKISECDLEFSVCRGSGPGGQKRNKTETDVQVKHIPTGMIVRCGSSRSQHSNRAEAIAMLSSRLAAIDSGSKLKNEALSRLKQIGSGERSDKIRTIQFKNGVVSNNVTGAKASIHRYLSGDIWCI